MTTGLECMGAERGSLGVFSVTADGVGEEEVVFVGVEFIVRFRGMVEGAARADLAPIFSGCLRGEEGDECWRKG